MSPLGHAFRRIKPRQPLVLPNTTHISPSSCSRALSSKADVFTKVTLHKSTDSSATPSDVPNATKKKTQAELDKELELKMRGLAGDGGESGVEFEDGQPVSMKRSVKNNMFRYI